jgi:hypothetical protein
MQQLELRTDARRSEPAVGPLPRLAGIAVLTEHLEVVQIKRELGIQDPRLDVIHLQLHPVVPLAAPVEHALRSSTVQERVYAERLVADGVPFARAIENSMIENLSAT